MRVVIGRESDKLNKKDLIILTANIKLADIINGLKSDCYRCPVALATARELRNYSETSLSLDVGEEAISLYSTSGDVYTTKMPQEMLEFISKFDSGKTVSPFSSTLVFERI